MFLILPRGFRFQRKLGSWLLAFCIDAEFKGRLHREAFYRSGEACPKPLVRGRSALGIDQDSERLLGRGGQYLSAAGPRAPGAGPRRGGQRAQVCGELGGGGGRRAAGGGVRASSGGAVGDAEAPPLLRTSRRGPAGGADPRPSLLLCRRGRQGSGESALGADLGNRSARGVREAAEDRRPRSDPKGRWGTLTFFTRLTWE